MKTRPAYVWLILSLAIAVPAAGQPPATPQFPDPPVSMGQPARVRYTLGPLGGYDLDRDAWAGRVFVDVTTRGLYPQFGIGSLTTELALGTIENDFDYALGAYFKIPWIRIGGEYNFVDRKFIPAVTAELAVTRGGLFNRGDEFRIDVRPWARQLYVGITFNNPLAKYRRTRPLKNYTKIPKAPKPKGPDGALSEPDEARAAALDSALAEVDHGLRWMDRLLTPHFKSGNEFGKSASFYRDHVSTPGHTFPEEDDRYHRALETAFTVAAGGNGRSGRVAADAAEAIILNEIVIPWNRLFGQNKDPHHPRGFVANAIRAFETWLAEVDHESQRGNNPEATREIFRRVTAVIQDIAMDNRNRWKQAHLIWLRQSRLVWLPLNYGLRREQYDTQAEVDSVISNLTESEFSDANSIEYLLNEQFHIHLKKTIRDTETYHVFIIHDFRGRVRSGPTDVIGWDVVVDGYIRAFQQAIREMDAGTRSRLPQFILFLDEVYYQDNKSREIITYLENLYDGAGMKLQNESVQARVDAAHESLRRTVAASTVLRDLDENRLRGLIKLHVNITNPFDPAFADDSPLRDHRKIVFRDVFEDDPALGVAIFTGQGVGEHYNGPGWEDRSLEVRGPALLALKETARRLFLSQGHHNDEVPEFLRPRPVPADYSGMEAELRLNGWTTPLAVVMNDTGFGEKKATVLKAVLYNLAGPGSVMIAMDSLWISEYWAGMFVAAAMRGAHVFPVCPGAANAPSSAAPTMFLMRENMEMMLIARDYFRDSIQRAGGSLHVGMYTTDIPVHDLERRLGAFLDGLERYPFLAERFALHPATVAFLKKTRENFHAVFPPRTPDRTRVPELGCAHKPFLHMKTQLFASEQAFSIFARPEWRPVIARYLTIRHRQSLGLPSAGITPALLREPQSEYQETDLQTAFAESLASRPAPACHQAVFVLTVGSHNQDRRGMLLDGEVLVAVSGCDATIALPDLMFLLGTSFWPDSVQELRTEFPRKSPGWLKRLYFGIKDAI